MVNSLLTNIHTTKLITENVIFRHLYMSKYVQEKKHIHKKFKFSPFFMFFLKV